MEGSARSLAVSNPLAGGGSRPDPSAIIDLATAYWQSQVLLAARRLDLFTHLAEGPKSVAELAAASGLPERSLELLLQALTSLGLLDKHEGRFTNTRDAAVFLVRGSPADLGPALAYAEDQYPLWGRLSEAVRSGQPALEAGAYLGDDPDRTRRFVLGMHHRALGSAPAVIAQIDLGGRKRLLDVGGGPGTYSAIMVGLQQGLHATVVDLPAVAAIARELIATAGLSERVEVRPGDYTKDEFGTGYDLALISGVLHRETPEACAALVRKTAAALTAGGRMVLSDIMLDDERTGPRFATLFALQMFLTSPHGGAHSVLDHYNWMEAAGLGNIRHVILPPPLNYTVVTAEAP